MIGRKKYFLVEGQFIITTVPAEIITVLGSCVSVCLWDKSKRMGAMNHYLLPGNDDDEAGNPSRGISATKMLIRSMINRQGDVKNIEAKIFGGSNSLQNIKGKLSVGERNVEVALHVLKDAGISVIANQTGGSFGRKIIFNTRTGKVRMRLLTKPLTEIIEEINKGFGY